MNDDSLIKDEFHDVRRIGRSKVERPNEGGRAIRPGPLRVKNIFEPPVAPVAVPARSPVRLSKSLRRQYGSGKLKVSQEKRCRICPNAGRITRHHLVPQSWFIGQDEEIKNVMNVDANIIPLCETCHRIVDGVRDPVSRLKKRAAIRDKLGNNEYAYILQVVGEVWLDEHYPKNP